MQLRVRGVRSQRIDIKIQFYLVCEPSEEMLNFKPLHRGTQHFSGTVSNEGTREMVHPAWPAHLRPQHCDLTINVCQLRVA